MAQEPVSEAAPVAPAVQVAAPEETTTEAQPVVEAAPQSATQATPQAEAAIELQPAATPVEAAQPAPVAARPAARSSLSAQALQPVLESAGLVWVNTDAGKLRAAQEAAAQAAKPARVPRERKPLPAADSAPMQQVETAKHQQ